MFQRLILTSVVNLIHCMPLEAPEGIFQHLTIPSYGRSLLVQGAWVAAYGPWLNDDGSYKSQADKDVGFTLVILFGRGANGQCSLRARM